MVHVLEGLETEDLRCSPLAILCDETVAQLVDKKIFRRSVRLRAVG